MSSPIHASYQAGNILAAAITVNYQTVLSLTDDIDLIFILDSLDEDVYVRLGGGADIYVPASYSFAVNFRSNDKRLPLGLVEVKAVSALPTTGVFSVTVYR